MTKSMLGIKRNLIKVLILVFLLGLIFAFASETLAQCDVGRLCGQVNWPRSPTGTSVNLTWQERDGRCLCILEEGFPRFVRYFYEWGIFLGGLAAFIALLIAGFLYLTSVGDPARMADAKDRAFWAIGGLALLLASWLILNTINPELTSFSELSFDPRVPSVVRECETDDDCRELGANCRCFIPSGQDIGSCLCIEPESPACTRVVLYNEPNFREPVRELRASETEGSACEHYTGWFFASLRKGIHPQSSKGYFPYAGYPCTENDYSDCLEDGKCYILNKETGVLVRPIPPANPLDDCIGLDIDPETEVCRCIKCRGTIQLFRKLFCEDMLAQLPATNRIISLEGTVRSATLFIETPH